MSSTPTFNLLLVEDNPGDVRLTKEILKGSKYVKEMSVAYDGEEAIAFLLKEGVHSNAPTPHLILLDLNLPKKNGLEVLEVVKKDDKLRKIPVVILTSSESDHDVARSYHVNANSYVTKPVNFDDYFDMVSCIEEFWFSIAQLPEQ